MSLLADFKKFAMRGNVIDLAVAVVIGAAFGRIVTSFVNDVLMPPIGLMLGGVDFTEFMITLKDATEEAAAVTINYGAFIQQVVNFTIVAFAIFMVIKSFERMKKGGSRTFCTTQAVSRRGPAYRNPGSVKRKINREFSNRGRRGK